LDRGKGNQPVFVEFALHGLVLTRNTFTLAPSMRSHKRHVRVRRGSASHADGPGAHLSVARVLPGERTCSWMNTPFLLAVMTSSSPSPLMSATANWVPTPESVSMTCGRKCTSPSLLRLASNQYSIAGQSEPGSARPCDHQRLPVTRSFRPSPLMSTKCSACVSDNSSLNRSCLMNSGLSLSPRCSCHQMPKWCAELLSTSARPSPFMSKAYMSAQASPSFAGWNFHGVWPSTFSGCSHQPSVQMTSLRPSPLMSPMPRPCEKRNVPGMILPGGALGSLIGCISHG